MRTILLLSLMLAGCCGSPIQRVVHVTTYKDGQTDIVRRDLLFRGKLEKNTVRDVLKATGMSEAVTVVTKGAK